MYKKLIEDLVSVNGITNKLQINKQIRRILDNNPIIYQSLLTTTSFLPEQYNIRARMHAVMNNITSVPLCRVCGIGMTFNEAKGEFNKLCANGNGSNCSSTLPAVADKRRKTLLENYGTDSIWNIPGMLDKRKTTNIQKYGGNSPMHSDAVKDKSVKTSLQRYGTTNAGQSDMARHNRYLTNMAKFGSSTFAGSQVPESVRAILDNKESLVDLLTQFSVAEIAAKLKTTTYMIRHYMDNYNIVAQTLPAKLTSAPQQDIANMLDMYGVEYIMNDRTIISPKHIDIWIPQHNVAIEIDGIFFHSELSGKSRSYHSDKTKDCSNKNIQLIHVWTPELKYRCPIVMSRIMHILKISQRRVYARCTTLRKITKEQSTKFFEDNHIQGNVHSSTTYGLYYNDELIAAMSFIKSRFSKRYQWELLRYCTKLNTSVTGGASKLLAAFMSEYKPTSIVSYCDLRWGTGNLYQQLGFVYLHTSAPNYFYFKRAGITDNLFSRVTFQKHKLSEKLATFDPVLTEWENMVSNGYDRIWDCGNGVYVMNNITHK